MTTWQTIQLSGVQDQGCSVLFFYNFLASKIKLAGQILFHRPTNTNRGFQSYITTAALPETHLVIRNETLLGLDRGTYFVPHHKGNLAWGEGLRRRRRRKLTKQWTMCSHYLTKKFVNHSSKLSISIFFHQGRSLVPSATDLIDWIITWSQRAADLSVHSWMTETRSPTRWYSKASHFCFVAGGWCPNPYM